MRSTQLLRSCHLFVLLLTGSLLTGCGGASGEKSAARAIENVVVATEEFGVLLADIRTSDDLNKAKPELLRKARAITDATAAMNADVLDNPRLSDEAKSAAIEPYQMRLAAADRLWRDEAQRIQNSLGNDALKEVSDILAQPR